MSALPAAGTGDVPSGDREAVEVGFVLRDHPYLGYRVEDRINLEQAYETDILQGAFMGHSILRLPGGDFSTPAQNRGWRGLVEWCLRLDAALCQIGAGADAHDMNFPDSDELIHIRRDGNDLVFSHTDSDTRARVEASVFVERATTFVRESVEWIDANYPAAKRNPAARGFWERLDPYRSP